MATHDIHTDQIDPRKADDFTVEHTAESLAGSRVLEVRYDPSSFDTDEGKIRLLNALDKLRDRIEAGDFTWPATDETA